MMKRCRRKMQPVRTSEMPTKSKLSTPSKTKPYSHILLLLLVLISSLHIQPSQATCPTIFFAQAIGHIKVAQIDFYYTKTGVPTTAECATFCGQRQFCRSAVYNHDARTCALSYEKFIECSTTKQRYNTFHLTTDGADSLSIVACIDPCTKPVSGNGEPFKLLYADGQDPNAQWRRWLPPTNHSSSIPLPPTPKTLFSTPDKGDTVEKKSLSANNNIAQPIVPINHPSSSGSSSLQTHGSSGDNPISPWASRFLIGDHIQVDQTKSNSGFLEAIHKLNEISEKLAQKEKEQLAERNGTGNANEKVTFNSMPLHLQEVFNGATSSQEARDKLMAAQEQKVNDDNAIRNFQNGTESKVHSGGFVKWLKPGEKLSLLSPDLKGGERNQVEIRGIQGQVPIQLVTIAPDLFDRSTSASTEAKKTVTAASRIKVIKESESIVLKKKNDLNGYEGGSLGEPIVINGHILTAKETQDLLAKERTSSTTTTTASPWKPAGLIGEGVDSGGSVEHDSSPKTRGREDEVFKTSFRRGGTEKQKPYSALQDDQGFLNTFLIQGLSSMFNKNGEGKEDVLVASYTPPGTTTTTTTTTTPAGPTTTTTRGPIICYRYVPQQRLLYAEFKKGRNVTLNECRCACAETWRNASSDKQGSFCKSLSFNEETGECSLNRADHTGKYDLIFDKKVDYHYVSCDIPYLLTTATKMCHGSEKAKGKAAQRSKSNEKSDSKPSRTNTPTQRPGTTPSVKSTPQATTTTTTIPPTTVINKPATNSAVSPSMILAQKIKENRLQSAKAHGTQISKQSASSAEGDSKLLERTTKGPTPFNKLIREEDDKSSHEEPDILIAETTTNPSKLFSTKLILANLTEPSTLLVSSPPIKMGEMTTLSLSGSLPTEPTTKLKEKATTAKPRPSTTTAKPVPTQAAALLNAKRNGCFEVIEGHAMNNTAGGLERDVSMEECQCFCANSLTSKRYSFQCTSATYYHKERDCILNLGNRQLTPDIFVENDQPETKLTYLGLICTPAKAVDLHVKDSYMNGCQNIQSKKEGALAGTSTHSPRTTTAAAHTDECFLELPNHVLEGTALAIETNVTVEECKCFCVDSEHRYGTECQSLQYYFDSQTCLLNKENRITDPDRFNYDPGSNVMHSYFDYRCHVEKLILSTYIEQVCQMVIQVSIKDLLKPVKTNPSLNIDDKSTEAAGSIKPMDDNTKSKSGKLGILSKQAKETTTEKHSTLSRKLRTTTSLPMSTTTTTTTTTTTPVATTTTTVNGFGPLDGSEEEADFTELKFESTSTPAPKLTTQANTPESKPVAPKVGKSITIFKKRKNAQKTIIPELEENEEEDEIEATAAAMAATAQRVNETNKEDENSKEVDDETHHDPPSTSTSTKTTPASTEGPTAIPVTTTAPTSTTLRTNPLLTSTYRPPSTTTTMYQYPTVGPCRYSALYQTVFNGGRLLKRITVTSPAQCFAACHAERCRSANLIQYEGNLKYCELYRDSIVEFRRTDVLSFDRGAVHFDSIQCDEA